jgi:hypothetical protein
VEAHGVKLVGYSDLEGRPGFKIALHRDGERWLLYLGHFWHSGWTVVDVTDPSEPTPIGFIEGPPNTWTLQVQAADGLLVTSMEHPETGWGFERDPVSAEGVAIYDLAADPITPPRIGMYHTGGRGTHRNFYAGGPYAYLAANQEGFHGNILTVISLEDPSQPEEISRWWVPGQHLAGGEIPEHDYYLHGPAHVEGDLAYAGFGGAGMVILDVADPARPRKVGGLDFRGFGSKIGCHSVVPLPGTDLVAVNSEAIDEHGHEPHNYCFLVDVSDPTSPWVVGSVPQPNPGDGLGLHSYFDKGGRFGPHNQHHPQGDLVHSRPDLLFMTYFNAGLRIFDVAEPRAPREVAWYVPEAPVERRGVLPHDLETQFEDVLVDRRGNIYCTDKNWGLFVLRADVLGI